MNPIVRLCRGPIGYVLLIAAGCFHTGGAAFAQTSPGTAALGDPFEVHGLLYSGSAPAGFPFGDGWAQGATFLGVLDEDGNPAPNTLGFPFRAARMVDENWGNEGDGYDPTMFTSGNKNEDLIGLGQNPWAWGSGGGSPAKNDITNTYFHTRVDPLTGDRWVFVAAETRSISGDSHADFEFNQAGVLQDGTTSGFLIGLGPNGGRTVNDFMITIDFTQGGRTPEASVRFWNGAAFELVSVPGAVFSATNFVDIPHGQNGSWKHFTDDGAEANVLTHLQLVEGAANLSALGIFVDACNPDSTFMAKTRSSTSWTADMKDFALVYFPIEPPPEVVIETVQRVCGGTTFQATAREVTGLPKTSLQWTLSGCGTMLTDPTASVVTVQADPVCDCEIVLSATATGGECGHVIVARTTVAVGDVVVPTLSDEPADLTVECDAVPPAVVLTAADECSEPTLQFDEAEEPGDCTGSSTILRTWTALDGCSHATAYTQVVTVEDTTSPSLSGVPADANASCDDIPAPPEVTGSDNCSDATVEGTESVQPGDCDGEATIIRTWTGTDACGNAVSQSQVLTVSDTAAPVLSGVPTNATVECDAVPVADVVSATDNCSAPGVQPAESTTPGRCVGEATVTRTWTATDACGNQDAQNQVITVVDTTAPVLIGVPGDQSVECDSIPSPPQVTADDNCSEPVVELDEEIVPGPGAGRAMITRTWTATDSCGNYTSQTQIITVIDTTAPVLHGVPVDETVECDAIPEPPVVTATDNCATPPVIFEEQVEPGDCEGQATVTRTWTATDDSGNPTSRSQVITVIDTTSPEINTILADITAECDAVPLPATVTASDNCSNPTVQLREVTEPGACAGESVMTRTWTATDDCGNQDTLIQTIHIVDTQSPTLSADPADVQVSCDNVPAPFELAGTDSCSDVTIEQSETVQPGACQGQSTITRTWTGTDACGNAVSQSQVLTVSDTAAPVLSGVPTNATVECDAVPVADVVSATDNCSAPGVQPTEGTTPGRCVGEATVTRTWTATDACGNQDAKDQIITVVDTTAPVLIGVPGDQSVECDSIPSPPQVTADDNCSEPVVELDEEIVPGPGAGRAMITRTWTATDSCGNYTSQTQIITVIDTTAPVLHGVPVDETVECDAIPEPPVVTATDNCATPPVIFEEQVEPGDCEGQATVTRTWTATDDSGNPTSRSQIITVIDTTSPVINTIVADITAECDAVPLPATVTASDNCSNPTVQLREVTEPGACLGESVMTRTWTATDDCGNQDTLIQTIHIVDTQSPTLSADPADVVAECGSVPSAPKLTANDACDPNVSVAAQETTTPGSCPADYELFRTWNAVDDCGNAISADQAVQVQDTTPPEIVLSTNGVLYICPDQAAEFYITAKDKCTAAEFTLTELVVLTANYRDRATISSLPDGGVKIVTPSPTYIRGRYAAMDECGNISAPVEFSTSSRYGLEACSIGFWKTHPEEWGPTGLRPDLLFVDVFQITDFSSPEISRRFTPTLTLGEALEGPGGIFDSTVAEGTAGMLNAAYKMQYPYNVATVRRIMQRAFSGEISFSEAKTLFQDAHTVRNECGCPPQRS